MSIPKKFYNLADDIIFHVENSDTEIIQNRYPIKDLPKLKHHARDKRNMKYGNNLYVRGCLDFSNNCEKSCSFCGLSKSNIGLVRYTLQADEMIQCIDEIMNLGIKNLHLVGGEINRDWTFLFDTVSYAHSKGIETTIVAGELDVNLYDELKARGATRYILKFETSNPRLYTKHKSGKELCERVAHLLQLREMGYKIGTGNIVGLPETTINDFYRDLLLIDCLRPDMASTSTFVSNPQAALSCYPDGDIAQTCLFTSMIRLVSEDYNPMISSASSFGREAQIQTIFSGANVISCHITPQEYVPYFVSHMENNKNKMKFDSLKKLCESINMKIADYVFE